MKLLFKQRLFSWFDSYDIYDEAGNTVYVVKGQLSWGHKLVIYDAVFINFEFRKKSKYFLNNHSYFISIQMS